MGDNGRGVEIGSHNATMVKEENNIFISRKVVSESYKDYTEDNQKLMQDWKGDTAEVFASYSIHMNEKLEDALGLIGGFRYNLLDFYRKSLQIDVQASANAEGVNDDGM